MWRCRERVDGDEWLDDPNLPPADVAGNLRDLELVNRLLGGAHAVLAHVKPVLDSMPLERSLSVLDIACGAGDILRAIAGYARRQGRKIEGIGVDLNSMVLAYAMGKSKGFPELCWVRADALHLPFGPRSFDLVICSAFLHQLDSADASSFLRSVTPLFRDGLVVSDLVRSCLGYLGFGIFARLAGFHRVSRHDGSISVRRAYRPEEMASIASAAGLANWSVQRHPLCRMTMTCGPQEG